MTYRYRYVKRLYQSAIALLGLRCEAEAVVAPTTADLIEALRRPGESYEALAARLPISLSTLNRWKKKSPQDWDGLLRMLEMAGWLNTDKSGTVIPLSRAEEERRSRLLAEAEAALARLREELG